MKEVLYYRLPEQLKFPTLWMRFPTKKVVNLFFGRKSHPEGRKSFCSAFVVFLRETFLFVESTRGGPGERPTPTTPHALLLSLRKMVVSLPRRGGGGRGGRGRGRGGTPFRGRGA